MSDPNKIRKWVVEKFDGISPGLLCRHKTDTGYLEVGSSCPGSFRRFMQSKGIKTLKGSDQDTSSERSE